MPSHILSSSPWYSSAPGLLVPTFFLLFRLLSNVVSLLLLLFRPVSLLLFYSENRRCTSFNVWLCFGQHVRTSLSSFFRRKDHYRLYVQGHNRPLDREYSTNPPVHQSPSEYPFHSWDLDSAKPHMDSKVFHPKKQEDEPDHGYCQFCGSFDVVGFLIMFLKYSRRSRDSTLPFHVLVPDLLSKCSSSCIMVNATLPRIQLTLFGLISIYLLSRCNLTRGTSRSLEYSISLPRRLIIFAKWLEQLPFWFMFSVGYANAPCPLEVRLARWAARFPTSLSQFLAGSTVITWSSSVCKVFKTFSILSVTFSCFHVLC